MEWFRDTVDTVLSPERLVLPAAVEGTHRRLLAYASRLELGGRIPGAAGYTDKHWLVACGSTSAEVEAVVSAGLAAFEGDDLVVEGYDAKGEDLLRRKRGGGKTRAAAPRTPGGTFAATAATSAARSPGSSPATTPTTQDRTGQDTTEQDGTGEDSAAGAAPPLELTPPVARKKKAAKKATNPAHAPFAKWWEEAYSERHERAPYLFTEADHGIVGDLLRRAGAEELQARARLYLESTEWFAKDGHDLKGLRRHWNLLAPGAGGARSGRNGVKATGTETYQDGDRTDEL